VIYRLLPVLLIATFLLPPASLADHLADGEFLVVDVYDGESILVQSDNGTQYTVRYLGVDTPQWNDPDRGIECWGPEATQLNRQLVLGARVYLERDTSDVDRYGRLLRYVWLDDRLVEALLLAEGYARAYSYGPDQRRRTQLEGFEAPAYEARLGMWGNCPAYTEYSDLDAPETSGRAVEYGMNVFVFGEESTTARDLGKVVDAGFGWQKSLFQWRWIEIEKGVFNWVEADRVVKASNDAGLKIVARLDALPPWTRNDNFLDGPPLRYDDYGDFVAAFVDRYRAGSPFGTVHAVQLWNEPNLTREWGQQTINRQSAVDYVRLLCSGYRGAKRAWSGITVISGALAPTGTRSTDAMDDTVYLQWMYEAGAGACFDTLGANGAGYKAPPWVSPEEVASTPAYGFHPSFGFRRVEQLREIMVRNGDASKPVWIMEFGWTSDPNNPSYAWHRVTEEEKARYVVEAYRWANRNWKGWIGVMLVWNVASPGWTTDDERYWWSITNPDGTNRPAYDALLAARRTGYLP
jgi:endonuclease YncB( thermonuclease family)